MKFFKCQIEIEKIFEVNAQMDELATSLMMAAKGGYTEIVEEKT